MLVNKSRLRELTGDYRLSHDFAKALEARMEEAVERAKERASSNGRRTLMPHDL